MVKPVNKGFTLLEMMIVMLCVSVFSLIFIPKIVVYDHKNFNPLTCQLEAMAHKKKCEYNETISYNQNGNINHAQTIKVNKKTCIFQLGMGRFRCE